MSGKSSMRILKNPFSLFIFLNLHGHFYKLLFLKCSCSSLLTLQTCFPLELFEYFAEVSMICLLHHLPFVQYSICIPLPSVRNHLHYTLIVNPNNISIFRRQTHKDTNQTPTIPTQCSILLNPNLGITPLPPFL